MSKIYVILVEYCMKLTLLFVSKGSNYYKHVEKKRSCGQGFQQYRVCMKIISLRMPNQGIRHK